MSEHSTRVVIALAVILTASTFGSTAQAVRPTDEVLERLRSEGRLQEFIDLDAGARRRGLDQPDPERLAAAGMNPVIGNLNVLVILVDFSDNPAAGGGTFADTNYFNQLLFSTNVPGYSMNDHYQEMSYGQVSISGRSVGWLRMPQTYAYYVNGQRGFGSYPRNAQKLAEDAVDAAEAAGVNFSLYDNDHDGTIDGLFIVHAGPGYEETGNVNQIHSHQWALAAARVYDGVRIVYYTMEPEEQASGLPIDVGVFSHEFGHFLGLPDLYDTDYSSAGLGRWCLMASGSWANGGTTPSHMSAWCKYALGWITPQNVTSNLTGAGLPQIQTDAVAYRLWAGGATGSQYFLVENRQATGFDAYLRGTGLCIYHIDEAKWGNDQEWYPGLSGSQHYLVALEQADGAYHLEHGSNSGDAADTWPGSLDRREFSQFTSPDSRAYNGSSTQIAVWNISTSDSLMTANLDIYFSQPHFDFVSNVFTDDGNSDGRPDPGEQVALVVSHRNAGAGVADAEYSVSCGDPAISFTDSTASVGAVATGATAANTADPFVFLIPADFTPQVVLFYLSVRADAGAYLKTDTVRVAVGPDMVLLVDDDARLSLARSYDSAYIMPVLDSLRVTYASWEIKGQGVPPGMSRYPVVIWYTGDRRTNPVSGPDTTLTPAERTAIAQYLDGGGRLWITGQQIASMLDVADSAFMHNYLHASYGGPFNDFIARGVGGDVVGDGTSYVLGGAGGAANQMAKDLLIPVNGGLPAFAEDANPGNITGVRYQGAHRVLFLGWGVEGIGDDVAYLFNAQKKADLIGRVIDWLVYNAVFTGVTLQPLVVNPGQDASHLVDTNIDLYWSFESPVGDPQDSVQVEVGSNADWSVAEYWTYGPVASADTSVHYAGPAAAPGQTFHWRVRVFASGAWTNWSNSSWHMNAAPAAPMPSSPINDQIATQNGPLLRSNNASDPEGDVCTYDFEVYADSGLVTLLASASGIPQGGSTTSWTVDVQLVEQSRDWWRVRARDGYYAGPWSSARSFRVDGINEPPTAPLLDSPADSAVMFKTDFDCAWSGASDPDLIETLRYRVRLDTLPDLSTARVFDSLAGSPLHRAGMLQPARTYFWAVTVFDKGGLQVTSGIRSFANLLAGDANGDASVKSSDVIFLVNFVFKGGPAPNPAAAGDVDASCTITSADIIYLVNYVFKSGPLPKIGCAPAAPSVPPDMNDR